MSENLAENKEKNLKNIDLTQFELTKALYACNVFEKVKLKPTAKLFLWALCTHYNPKKETMFPSQNTVAKKLGISTKSAERAVFELKEKGILTYTTKRVNHYVFSEKFFEMVKMSDGLSQIVGYRNRQKVGLTNKIEHENNNNFSKNKFFTSAKSLQEGGKALPSIEETQKYIEQVEENRQNFKNPLDFNKDEALRWLKATPKWLIERSSVANVLMKRYLIDIDDI